MRAALSAIGSKSVAPCVEGGVSIEPALAPALDDAEQSESRLVSLLLR
jgi:hypothetical protein